MQASINGDVLPLFVKFSRRSKKNKFVKFHKFGKKNSKTWKIGKLREKRVENMGEKLSDKNGLYSLLYQVHTLGVKQGPLRRNIYVDKRF